MLCCVHCHLYMYGTFVCIKKKCMGHLYKCIYSNIQKCPNFRFQGSFLYAVHEITVGHRSLFRHDFKCDQQDSFSADHNDGQVFKIQ